MSKLHEINANRREYYISLKLRLWMENSNTEVKEQEDKTQIRSFTCALFEERTLLLLSSTQCSINSKFLWFGFH